MLPYKRLTKSAISAELLDLANNNDSWFKYYNFDALLVPQEILNKDPFFAGLPPFRAGILRLPPYTCYDWHTDDDRGWSINMLLTSGKSNCLFSSREGQAFPFTELVYEPEFYYAFNTQVPHTVLNFESVRYVFSVEFI